MSDRLLNGLRAIDLSTAAAFDCGRMLAALGIEVIRVDLPDADTASLAWRLGNCDKSCLTLDYRTPEGMEALRQLIRDSEFLIESFRPGHLLNLGLDVDALCHSDTGLITLSITPFGQTGPYSAYKGADLVVSAMSSLMSTCGLPNREPMREPGDAHLFHACGAAATAAMAAHFERRRSGRGQWIDISAQEVGASRNLIWFVCDYFEKRGVKREGPLLNLGVGGSRVVWNTQDGYAFTQVGAAHSPQSKAFAAWMDDVGHPHPAIGPDADSDVAEAWDASLAGFMRERTGETLFQQSPERDLAILPVNAPSAVLKDLQLQDRAFFTPPMADLSELPLPRWFIKTSLDTPDPTPPRRVVSVAKRHQRPVYAKNASSRLPLEGVRVLDFSWAIVGSVTAKYLADLGADVIKVEGAKRLPRERVMSQVKISRADDVDDKPWFAQLNTSKRSMAVDLAAPEGQALMHRLVEWADLVFENFAPGVIARLGVGYEALTKIKPSIIMASGSIFGQTGPFGPLPGTDGSGGARSGRIFMTGYEDADPVVPSAPYGDSMVPTLLAPTIIAALIRREETGEGCRIDGAMLEVLTQQMFKDIAQAELTGRDERIGNRDYLYAPHNVYPCTGEDAWIAISVFDEAEWGRLCSLMGRAALADDPRFCDAPARKRNEAALDAEIGAWTRERERYALMHALQAAGVPAGAVQTAREVMNDDPQIKARALFEELDHTVLGAFPHLRSPLSLSRTPPRMTPAPRLGEHTVRICRDELGMDWPAIAAVRSKGVIR